MERWKDGKKGPQGLADSAPRYGVGVARDRWCRDGAQQCCALRWAARELRTYICVADRVDSQTWLSLFSLRLGFLLGFDDAFFENAKGEVRLLFVDQ